jgi:hypothetical protein
MKPITELIKVVGKLALESGENWRLDHPELMDAYEACLKEMKEELEAIDIGG